MQRVEIGNPDCKTALAFLDAYLSNELTVETAAQIGRHLERCLGCRKELGVRKQIKERLQRALLRDRVSPALRKHISRMMRRQDSFWILRLFG